MVALAITAVVGLMAWVYLMWGDDHSDIGVYHRYALAMLTPSGTHHLPAEYPILALVPFSLTLIPAGDYGAVYALAMAGILLAGFFVAWRTAARSVATAFIVYLLLAGPWTVLGRYDLVTSLVVLGAVLAAGRGRWLPAYALLAAGVLLKLYPLVLGPLFLIEHWRQRPRARDLAAGPAVFALIVAAGVATAALLDPAGALSPLRYALGRPIESESVQATVLWILSGLRSPGSLVQSFNSANVVSPVSPAVGLVSLVALGAGLAVVYARLAAGRLTLTAACLGAVIVVVVTSKVLSPQYLVWLLPLAAFDRGLSPLWVAICVLTFLVYPTLFVLAGLGDAEQATAFSPTFLFAAAVRNALLLVALVHVLRAEPEARLSSVR